MSQTRDGNDARGGTSFVCVNGVTMPYPQPQPYTPAHTISISPHAVGVITHPSTVDADSAIATLTRAIAAQERQDRLRRLLACHPDALEGIVTELLRDSKTLNALRSALREIM
jgi:hypothetical protein